MPILGIDLRRDALLDALRRALDIAWPDRPTQLGDVETFLHQARRKIVDAAAALDGVEGFVPAARWTDAGRERLLEHLHLDIGMLVGGVRAEGLWGAFGEMPDTEPLGELIVAGMLIKMRSVGAFLIQKPSTRDDELRPPSSSLPVPGTSLATSRSRSGCCSSNCRSISRWLT